MDFAEDVLVADDSDQLSGLIYNRKTSDVLADQNIHSLIERG
jgi:hypothetical protein